ncbi:MAG: head GIN domain-containing protein, partial [Bacteroidota bacterium]
GNGKVVEDKRELTGFSGIVFRGSGNVFVTQSDVESVRIIADDNILKCIKTYIRDNRLVITTKRPVCPSKFDVYVSLKNINSLILEGSGNISADKPIKTDLLKLEMNGSGNIKLFSIETNILKSEINGSGDISLAGTANECKAEINGSGNLNFLNLSINRFKAEINGSGNISATIIDEFMAEINGSGDISYKGNPKVFKTETNGSGSIRKIDK